MLSNRNEMSAQAERMAADKAMQEEITKPVGG